MTLQSLCILVLASPGLALRLAKEEECNPPEPYSYDTMIEWVKTEPCKHLKMPPQIEFFDVDMALTGEKAEWFAEFSRQSIRRVVKTVKKINRFHFMQKILASGDDITQASLPFHLLVLLRLTPKLSPTYNHLVYQRNAVDIGAGTGFLATAMSLLGMGLANVYGLDCPSVSADAQTFLEDWRHVHAKNLGHYGVFYPPKFLAGDLNEDSGLEAVKSYGLMDAVNIGIAVPDINSPEIKRASELLRNGGYLAVPIEDQSCSTKEIRCHAKFTVLKKRKEDGALEKVPGPEPEVTFLQGGKCPDQ